MNKIVLSGNLVKEVELRNTANGTSVVQNTIAVKNDYKNAKGEYDSEFINIVAWKQTAEYISKYASKGNKVLVEGKLRNRSYDKPDGTKGYVTEVIVEKVELLTFKKEEKPVVEEKKNNDDVYVDFGKQIEFEDEEYPF